VSKPPHQNNIPDRDWKVPIHLFPLGDISNAIEMMTEGEVMDENFASTEWQEPNQCLKQSGFTGAIGTYNSNARAMRNLKSNLPQDGYAIICNRYIINIQTSGRISESIHIILTLPL
jgi:hypothetical protein